MTTCENCKYGNKVPNYNNVYYCNKNIHEVKDKFNKPDFGCVRGKKK